MFKPTQVQMKTAHYLEKDGHTFDLPLVVLINAQESVEYQSIKHALHNLRMTDFKSYPLNNIKLQPIFGTYTTDKERDDLRSQELLAEVFENFKDQNKLHFLDYISSGLYVECEGSTESGYLFLTYNDMYTSVDAYYINDDAPCGSRHIREYNAGQFIDFHLPTLVF